MAEIQPSLNERLIAAQRRLAAEAERIARPAYDAYLREDEQVIAELLAEPGNEDAAPVPEPEREREATYPHSLTIEDEDKLRELWADDSLSKADIARLMMVGVDRLNQYKDKYQLPDRKRGRKPGQMST